jgi:hypothetical protein
MIINLICIGKHFLLYSSSAQPILHKRSAALWRHQACNVTATVGLLIERLKPAWLNLLSRINALSKPGSDFVIEKQHLSLACNRTADIEENAAVVDGYRTKAGV